MKITFSKRSILFFCGLLVVLGVGWFSYCPSPEYTLGEDRTIPIYVSYHDWHSAVGWHQLPGEILGAETWTSAPVVEFGWGDRDFFWGGDQSWLSILRMAVFPSPSVIHGASLPTTVDLWLKVPMQTVYVDQIAWRRLQEYVKNSFALDDRGQRQVLGAGQYDSNTPSNFYLARPLYSLWWNCNTWSAHALHYAGIPICPHRVWLIQQLQAQLQEVIKPKSTKNIP